MSAQSPEPQQSQIQQAGDRLGAAMDKTLPFRKTWFNWLWRTLGGCIDSSRITVAQDEEGLYQRIWLRRDFAGKNHESSVALLSDTVRVDLERESQIEQMGEDYTLLAKFNRNEGLFLPDSLGLPQEAMMERIQELGSFVTQITEEKIHAELKKAPDQTYRLGLFGSKHA